MYQLVVIILAAIGVCHAPFIVIPPCLVVSVFVLGLFPQNVFWGQKKYLKDTICMVPGTP